MLILLLKLANFYYLVDKLACGHYIYYKFLINPPLLVLYKSREQAREYKHAQTFPRRR